MKFVAGTGRPAVVLIQEWRGGELLVVGPRGRGGFAGLIMGSVSQKVLAHAACPVAFVHAGMPAKTAAGLPEQAARATPIDHVHHPRRALRR